MDQAKQKEQAPRKNQQPSAGMSRRAWLTGGACACAGLLLARIRNVHGVSAASREAAALPTEVSVVDFDTSGKQTGTVRVPTVIKTDAEWKAKLSPEAYQVARNDGTERPFTIKGWDEHGHGLFRCVCCDLALFRSETKFDSGTGWPSFWQPIAKQNVVERTDASLGMERTSVSCRQCNAHLGHVFDDGPRPTGLRYCMNAVAMRFMKTA